MANKPYGKWLDYVDGKLTPGYTDPTTVQQVKDFFPAVLALPYEPQKVHGEIPPEEEKLRGLTVGEVIVYRQAMLAASNPNVVAPDEITKAAQFVIDRVIGKPKQIVESTQVNVTYSDLLAKWAKEDEEKKEELLMLEQKQREQWTVLEFDKYGRPLHADAVDATIVAEDWEQLTDGI